MLRLLDLITKIILSGHNPWMDTA